MGTSLAWDTNPRIATSEKEAATKTWGISTKGGHKVDQLREITSFDSKPKQTSRAGEFSVPWMGTGIVEQRRCTQIEKCRMLNVEARKRRRR